MIVGRFGPSAKPGAYVVGMFLGQEAREAQSRRVRSRTAGHRQRSRSGFRGLELGHFLLGMGHGLLIQCIAFHTSVASVWVLTFFPRAVIKICLEDGIEVFRTIHPFKESGLEHSEQR